MLQPLRNKIERRLARQAHRSAIDLRPHPSVVSFTFDDMPRSACTDGARIVEEVGGRATYYVCGGYADTTTSHEFFRSDDLPRLHAAGHEIGSHGFAHIDYQNHALAEVAADLDGNERYLRDRGLPPPTQFAFPFGSVNPRLKRHCADRFASARGVQSAANRGTADRNLLKAVQLYDPQLSDAELDALMRAARGNGTWLIFLSHGVSDRPGSFDTSPRQLARAAGAARALELPMLTISQALRHFEAGANR